MVFENTDVKFWWTHTCEKYGKTFVHEWQASPKAMKNRRENDGCPICHGTKVLRGFNDLYTCCPELAEEWDDQKNRLLGLDIQNITCGSNRRVHWICKYCGHTWKAMVLQRTAKNTRCPKCAQRSQTSFPEQALYYCLKRYFPDCISRAKQIIPSGELDIFSPEAGFAVEYCGRFSHAEKTKKDADLQKQIACRERGITLVLVCEHADENAYFPDRHMIHCIPESGDGHLDYVIKCLSEELQNMGLLNGPISADWKAEECAIRAQYQQTRVENSIAVTHAELLETWDYEKNGLLKPKDFLPAAERLFFGSILR